MENRFRSGGTQQVLIPSLTDNKKRLAGYPVVRFQSSAALFHETVVLTPPAVMYVMTGRVHLLHGPALLKT